MSSPARWAPPETSRLRRTRSARRSRSIRDFEIAGVDLAGLLLQSARPLDAEAVLRTLLASRPDSAEAHASLGLALRLRGKTREALGHFAASLRAQPDDLGHLEQLCAVPSRP